MWTIILIAWNFARESFTAIRTLSSYGGEYSASTAGGTQDGGLSHAQLDEAGDFVNAGRGGASYSPHPRRGSGRISYERSGTSILVTMNVDWLTTQTGRSPVPKSHESYTRGADIKELRNVF